MISLITCMSEPTRVIGKNGSIPWRLPPDLNWFKRCTINKPVIMGRKTWKSLPKSVCPLPNRLNIILTSHLESMEKFETLDNNNPVFITDSLGRAITCAQGEGSVWNKENDEIVIIGGESLYKQAMDLIDRMYITYIHQPISGDTKFPEFDPKDWVDKLVSQGHYQGIDYRMVIYDRK